MAGEAGEAFSTGAGFPADSAAIAPLAAVPNGMVDANSINTGSTGNL
jgi:hypothetical protein